MSRFLVVLVISLVLGSNYCSGLGLQPRDSTGSAECGVVWDDKSPPCSLGVIPSNFTLSDISSKDSAKDINFQNPPPVHTLIVKFSSPLDNSNPTLIMDPSGFWKATTEPISLSIRLCDVNITKCTPYNTFTTALNSKPHVYSANLNTLLPGRGYRPYAFAFIQFLDLTGYNNSNWTSDDSGHAGDFGDGAAWHALFLQSNNYTGVVLSMSIQ